MLYFTVKGLVRGEGMIREIIREVGMIDGYSKFYYRVMSNCGSGQLRLFGLIEVSRSLDSGRLAVDLALLESVFRSDELVVCSDEQVSETEIFKVMGHNDGRRVGGFSLNVGEQNKVGRYDENNNNDDGVYDSMWATFWDGYGLFVEYLRRVRDDSVDFMDWYVYVFLERGRDLELDGFSFFDGVDYLESIRSWCLGNDDCR